MSKSKVRIDPVAVPPVLAKTVQNVSASVFSDDEIRLRAYQIYESRDRNGISPDEDWAQAQVELMEMLGGK